MILDITAILLMITWIFMGLAGSVSWWVVALMIAVAFGILVSSTIASVIVSRGKKEIDG